MKKGFTLIELIVVIVIVSTVAGFALVNYSKSYSQAYESDAVAQLRAVHTANKIYYAKHYSYWPETTGTEGLAAINSNLGINIMANGFTYTCATPDNGATYSCSAVRDGGAYTIKSADDDILSGCCDGGTCPTLPACP